jgi:hypothetical protein
MSTEFIFGLMNCVRTIVTREIINLKRGKVNLAYSFGGSSPCPVACVVFGPGEVAQHGWDCSRAGCLPHSSREAERE